ncbi:zinc carboxypeptidase A 1 [Thecamonas trahens ATCC 50062]|uniref:Zinc carboxypeptidase A 1 n=1 Tax=Thecamonas trahens ATCC 50062 TaxID=461836 RepID=A0A0L0DWV4_THETB|nr:zinc carboxypeptidase A 1 [Thecamonas trahens ATCC 50062]KNC56023.1 zinc carboxypeptidase A 1 [Thecamonas trahens ATCC 50062]|eukprot:XP_013761067.1 zinc carboxypeptidase A 1 [Thecamonas trahens ATCC 50062]
MSASRLRAALDEALARWPAESVTRPAEGHSRKDEQFLSFVSAMHARELLPSHALVSFVDEIGRALQAPASPSDSDCVAGMSRELAHWIRDTYTLHLLPLLNPDGRARVEATSNYCWRGNARGVDLNRNFPWAWGGEGASHNPRSEEYCGKTVLSEPESAFLAGYASSLVNPLQIFLSLHAGVHHIYLPFADSISRASGAAPDNHAAALAAAVAAAGTVACAHGVHFDVGRAADLSEYPADGTIFDFMAGAANVPFSYALELWGASNPAAAEGSLGCNPIFNPQDFELAPALAVAHTLISELLANAVPPSVPPAPHPRAAPGAVPRATLAALASAASPRALKIADLLRSTCHLAASETCP